PHFGPNSAPLVVEHRTRLQHPELDDCTEGHAGLTPLGAGRFERRGGDRLHLIYALSGCFGILRIPLDADPAAAEPLGYGTRRPRAEEGIEDNISGICRRHEDAMQQGLRLLRRMGFAAVGVLQTLRSCANREQPVRTHLQVVIAGLHGLVIERDPRFPITSSPDQRLVRIGEPLTAEIRHRVRLTPDDVVLDPEPQVLQGHAEAEDIVVRANDPNGAIALQHSATLAEPCPREPVVILKIGELVPLVVDAIDTGIVWPQKILVELQVVGGISEDEIDAGCRQLRQLLEAVADDDLIETDARVYPVTQNHDATRKTETSAGKETQPAETSSARKVNRGLRRVQG